MLNDSLHLLMHQLHAPQAGLLQTLDLPLDQQLEADLRHEQRGPGAVAVPDRSEDVHGREPRQRVDAVQGAPEGLMEDVADPGAAAQLRGLNVARGPVHRGHVGARELGDDLQQGRVLVHHVLAVGVEQSLELGRHHVHAGLQLGQTVSDVVHQQSVESLGQVAGAIPCGQCGVLSLEERRFVLNSVFDVFLVNDVLLRPVDDPDDAELDGDDAAAQDVDSVGARVHEIQLGDDGQRPPPVRVNIPRDLQRLRGGHVSIGRAHGEDD